MNAHDKRARQLAADRAMVQRMIDQGQLDLAECLDYDYLANMARHSLNWPPGRLQKIVSIMRTQNGK